MKIEELEETGVINFIFSEGYHNENFYTNTNDYYASIGKLIEEGGLDVTMESDLDNLLVESYPTVDIEEESWGRKFKRWVKKGIRFVKRIFQRIMKDLCGSDVIKNLKSKDSSLRKKAVQFIYNAICVAFPRMCARWPRLLNKLIGLVIKGIVVGVLKVVCPTSEEDYQFEYHLTN